MDLVRKIVFLIEDHPHGFAPDVQIDGHTEEEIGYHVHLMVQAGLIDGCDCSTSEFASPQAMATGLTWQGHEFAELARNETIWGKAKKIVKEKVGSTGISLLLEVLKDQAKQALGLH